MPYGIESKSSTESTANGTEQPLMASLFTLFTPGNEILFLIIQGRLRLKFHDIDRDGRFLLLESFF